jgi:hypothetical protein
MATKLILVPSPTTELSLAAAPLSAEREEWCARQARMLRETKQYEARHVVWALRTVCGYVVGEDTARRWLEECEPDRLN